MGVTPLTANSELHAPRDIGREGKNTGDTMVLSDITIPTMPEGRQSARPCFAVMRTTRALHAVWQNYVRVDDFNQSGGDRIA